MNYVKLISRAGLVVDIPQPEFDLLSAELGPVRARERALSDAGRALKHRRALAAHYAQVLTPDDQALIAQMARQLIRDSAIQQAARELGYGNYIDRIARGGHVPPESYARAMSRATERAGNIDDTPDDGALLIAAQELGFSTERDAEYSRAFTCAEWHITAPEGWNKQPATAPVAIA